MFQLQFVYSPVSHLNRESVHILDIFFRGGGDFKFGRVQKKDTSLSNNTKIPKMSMFYYKLGYHILPKVMEMTNFKHFYFGTMILFLQTYLKMRKR